MPGQNQRSEIAAPSGASGIGPSVAIGAGLGATPFMGMIGEQRITKDPFYDPNIKRMSSGRLSRLSQPGDVVLYGRRTDRSVRYKVPQHLTTGAEFYHAEPVMSKKRGGGIMGDAGHFDIKKYPEFKGDTPEVILKRGYGKRLTNMVGPEVVKDYQDAVLLRPKKGMTEAQLAEYRLNIAKGAQTPYSKSLGVRSLFRDLFLPKIKGVTGRIGPNIGPRIVCDGQTCSTLPASEFQKITGQTVAKGKHPMHALPADFLRSGSPYEPIGATMTHTGMSNPRMRLLKRLGFRAGIGGGMAGLGLTAYHEPEALGGMAAAAGVPMGARAVINKLRKTKAKDIKNDWLREQFTKIKPKGTGNVVMPTTPAMIEELPGVIRDRKAKQVMTKGMKQFLKRYATRTAPLGIGAGLGGYALLKALTSGSGGGNEGGVVE